MVSLAIVHRGELPPDDGRERRRAAILHHLSLKFASKLGMSSTQLSDSPLAKLAEGQKLSVTLEDAAGQFALSAKEEKAGGEHLRYSHRLGQALDLLLASEKGKYRRKLGSYYTPAAVARSLIVRSLVNPSLRSTITHGGKICDPACGGGAFLLEAAGETARLLQSEEVEATEARLRAKNQIYGLDLSPLAIAVVQVAFWLFVGDDSQSPSAEAQFQCVDTLSLALPTGVPLQFDWIVGNPPWVAFQGRATQKISIERRAFYRLNYQAFSGYPTLHGLFVERACQLAPHGSITLLLPSSVSDLEGYRAVRAVLNQRHRAAEPLEEFGQDAFTGVVQPCFGLIAEPIGEGGGQSGEEPWKLHERCRAGQSQAHAPPPPALMNLGHLQKLAPETFKEMGFQSNRVVASELFLRGDQAEGVFQEPLIEGRNVGEFVQRSPKLFLHPNREVLKATKCRLRAAADYQDVQLVVRQTAAYTIAAIHHGGRFRNSLIAGFASSSVDQYLLLGLLNSALFRALHVSRQRDARQATFPQVKVAHLRGLPAPPDNQVKRAVVRQLSVAADARGGLSQSGREELDAAVFALYDIEEASARSIVEYLHNMVPAALRPSL